MKQSIRFFIEKLNEINSLLKVSREVDPKFEIPSLMRSAEKLEKAILFEKVKGYKLPIINNIFGSRDILAMLFETSRENVVQEFIARIAEPILPRIFIACGVFPGYRQRSDSVPGVH